MRVEKAFPAIVSEDQFHRVRKVKSSRSPKAIHPRRVRSSFMLSGLIRCKTCNRALTGQFAKSGKYAYYVCPSLVKLGKGACETPRLNARHFEELVVGRIWSSVLAYSNMGDLTQVVAQELNAMEHEQRIRLETIESELADVRRRLDRVWRLVETTDDPPIRHGSPDQGQQ